MVNTVGSLVDCSRRANTPEEATEWYVQTEDALNSLIHAHESSMVDSLKGVAWSIKRSKAYNGAGRLPLRALEVQIEQLGPNDQQLALTLRQLCKCAAAQGRKR